MAKRYAQQLGIDFMETFALVAKMETIRTVLALAAQMELQVLQLGVKYAFFNGQNKRRCMLNCHMVMLLGDKNTRFTVFKRLYTESSKHSCVE